MPLPPLATWTGRARPGLRSCSPGGRCRRQLPVSRTSPWRGARVVRSRPARRGPPAPASTVRPVPAGHRGRRAPHPGAVRAASTSPDPSGVRAMTDSPAFSSRWRVAAVIAPLCAAALSVTTSYVLASEQSTATATVAAAVAEPAAAGDEASAALRAALRAESRKIATIRARVRLLRARTDTVKSAPLPVAASGSGSASYSGGSSSSGSGSSSAGGSGSGYVSNPAPPAHAVTGASGAGR